MMQSLAVVPYKFPRLDHIGGIAFSHLAEEASSPQAQLRQGGNEGLSF
jgi:hypothetical protein